VSARDAKGMLRTRPLFEIVDGPHLDRRLRQFAQLYSHNLQSACVEVPSPYWPQVLNTACQRLLNAGENDVLVRCVHRKVVRELTLTGIQPPRAQYPGPLPGAG
jgi:hypothetical protein